MAYQILLINQSRSLRKHTRRALKTQNLKIQHTVENVAQAEDFLRERHGHWFVILELNAALSAGDELEFVSRNLEPGGNHSIIVTMETIDPAGHDEFHKLGVQEFVQQSFVVEAFGRKLRESLEALVEARTRNPSATWL